MSSYIVSPNPNDGLNGIVPVGSVIMWSTMTAPSGWMLCDGSAISRNIHASLFAIIGTTFGPGDGLTTFNLPNTSGSTIRGDGGSFTPVGFVGGNDAPIIYSNNLPRHTHPITDPGHTHQFQQNVYNGNINSGIEQYQGNGQDSGPPNGYTFETGKPAGTREFTGINVTNFNSTTLTPLNVVNMFLVLQFIIKAS